MSQRSASAGFGASVPGSKVTSGSKRDWMTLPSARPVTMCGSTSLGSEPMLMWNTPSRLLRSTVDSRFEQELRNGHKRLRRHRIGTGDFLSILSLLWLTSRNQGDGVGGDGEAAAEIVDA